MVDIARQHLHHCLKSRLSRVHGDDRRAHDAAHRRVTRASGCNYLGRKVCFGDDSDRPFVTSDLIDALSDLTRLSFPGIDETRSLFSESFTPHRRLTAGRDYDSFKAGWAPDAAHAGGANVLPCGESAHDSADADEIRRGTDVRLTGRVNPLRAPRAN